MSKTTFSICKDSTYPRLYRIYATTPEITEVLDGPNDEVFSSEAEAELYADFLNKRELLLAKVS